MRDSKKKDQKLEEEEKIWAETLALKILEKLLTLRVGRSGDSLWGGKGGISPPH